MPLVKLFKNEDHSCPKLMSAKNIAELVEKGKPMITINKK